MSAVERAAAAPEGAFAIQFDIRVADLSPSAHVNNVAFVRYADEARMAFFGNDARTRSFRGGLLGALGERVNAVVGRHEIEYRREVFPEDGPLTLRLWVPWVGGSSFVVATEASTDGSPEPATVSETTIILVERATGRAWPPDDDTRAVLAGHAGPRPWRRGRPGP